MIQHDHYVVRGNMEALARHAFVELHGDPIIITDPGTAEVLGEWTPWVRGYVSARYPGCVIVVPVAYAHRMVKAGWKVLPARRESL